MDFTYLSEIVFNANFLFALALLTIFLWVLLQIFFGNASFWNALAIALLAIIFLPVLMEALSQGTFFVLILVLGALLFANSYGWSVTSSFLVALIAVFGAAMILPMF